MSILVDSGTRLICQGITGANGAFHAYQMLQCGTNLVAGVTPGKGGQLFDDRIPIFDTMAEAVAKTDANTSIIFVPAQFAADAILEAAEAETTLIVAITEGIPVLDMVKVKEYLRPTDTMRGHSSRGVQSGIFSIRLTSSRAVSGGLTHRLLDVRSGRSIDRAGYRSVHLYRYRW